MPLGSVEQIAFVDDDNIGFFELFAVDVEHLLGKLASFLQSEDAQRADRVRQHAQWRDKKIVAINPAQRIRDRRHQIGATADRLGDEHLGTRGGGQLVRSVHERVEPATKTAARNFFRSEPARAEHFRVHQFAALVVRDKADLQPLMGQVLRQPHHGDCLARAKEAADHVVAGFVLGSRVACRGDDNGRLTTDYRRVRL